MHLMLEVRPDRLLRLPLVHRVTFRWPAGIHAGDVAPRPEYRAPAKQGGSAARPAAPPGIASRYGGHFRRPESDDQRCPDAIRGGLSAWERSTPCWSESTTTPHRSPS